MLLPDDDGRLPEHVGGSSIRIGPICFVHVSSLFFDKISPVFEVQNYMIDMVIIKEFFRSKNYVCHKWRRSNDKIHWRVRRFLSIICYP